jgi:hypothetical protein
LKLKLAQFRIKVQLCTTILKLISNFFHIILAFFITLQPLLSGLSINTFCNSSASFQEDFTLIELNKEHAHSEASGLLLFSELSETETELNEAFAHMLKHIKQHFLIISVIADFILNNQSDEILKSESVTYHPSLLHIPLFLFTADMRI